MVNLVITNNTTRTIVVWEPVFDDDIFLATGVVTYPAGTVLGRITASGKLTDYDSGAVDGSEVPIAVLLDVLETTAAGDVPIRPVLGGRLRRGDVTAFNSGTPLALTQAEVDLLRDFTITLLSKTQLAELDNQ